MEVLKGKVVDWSRRKFFVSVVAKTRSVNTSFYSRRCISKKHIFLLRLFFQYYIIVTVCHPRGSVFTILRRYGKDNYLNILSARFRSFSSNFPQNSILYDIIFLTKHFFTYSNNCRLNKHKNNPEGFHGFRCNSSGNMLVIFQ